LDLVSNYFIGGTEYSDLKVSVSSLGVGFSCKVMGRWRLEGRAVGLEDLEDWFFTRKSRGKKELTGGVKKGWTRMES
jgi:hypothetical protein